MRRGKSPRKEGARRGALAAREIAYIALGVALITVCAWLSVPLGPVPFTLQTLAVALVGALLGWKRALAATATYILMGLAGVPVFSEFRAGAAALFGPTGGYIFGFLFLALAPALCKLAPVKNKWKRAALFYAGMVVGLAVCYCFGTVWFMKMYGCTFVYALTVCVVPYLLPDAAKFVIATILAVRLEKYVK